MFGNLYYRERPESDISSFPLMLQVAPGPYADGMDNLFQPCTIGRLEPLKTQITVGAVTSGLHVIKQQHMKMDIESERTAKTLG